MGRWTYYSPLLLGIGLALLSYDTVLGLDWIAGLPAWAGWIAIGGIALATGLVLQMFMLGAQGLSAQVLPVPGGRSIRGAGAVAGGWLIVATGGFAIAGAVLYSERMTTTGLVLLGLGAATGAAALVVYVWCWPTAQRDFATDAPPMGDALPATADRRG